MTTFVSEKPEHAEAITRVLDRGFGPGRFAKASERVRERGALAAPELSRVALDQAGAVIGVCRLWRVRAGEQECFFLGPLAVGPVAQGEGLGLALAREAVAAARAAGGRAIIVVGAEALFGQLGFSRVPEGRVTLPGPFATDRLLWLALAPGGLDRLSGELAAP